jgi:hypothetical protein
VAKSTNLNFTQNIKAPCVALTSANTTVAATLYTVSANDAVVKSLVASTNDTTAVNLVVSINNGISDFVLGTVNLPINSGYTGAIASVDILGSSLIPGLPRDINGRAVLPLPYGHVLKVGCLATMTAAKTTNVLANVEEY